MYPEPGMSCWVAFGWCSRRRICLRQCCLACALEGTSFFSPNGSFRIRTSWCVECNADTLAFSRLRRVMRRFSGVWCFLALCLRDHLLADINRVWRNCRLSTRVKKLWFLKYVVVSATAVAAAGELPSLCKTLPFSVWSYRLPSHWFKAIPLRSSATNDRHCRWTTVKMQNVAILRVALSATIYRAVKVLDSPHWAGGVSRRTLLVHYTRCVRSMQWTKSKKIPALLSITFRVRRSDRAFESATAVLLKKSKPGAERCWIGSPPPNVWLYTREKPENWRYYRIRGTLFTTVFSGRR